jgi:hypothetical protein
VIRDVTREHPGYLGIVFSPPPATSSGIQCVSKRAFEAIHLPSMTGRRAFPSRPITPTDPTLESRPPPRKCRFPLRSYGPGAAADIRQTTTATQELRHLANSSAASQTLEAEDNSDLLQRIEKWEKRGMWEDGRSVEPNPTWGFYVMVTDYSQTAKDNIDRAMENLLRVQHRALGANADPPDVYADEAYRRLKFDVVENPEALEGASGDRVRECFRALIRGLELWDDIDQFPPPPRNYVCLVIDSSKIEMLANLTLHDDHNENARSLSTCKLQAVDIFWQRPETTASSYRGVRELAIDTLPRTYLELSFLRLDRVEQ